MVTNGLYRLMKSIVKMFQTFQCALLKNFFCQKLGKYLGFFMMLEKSKNLSKNIFVKKVVLKIYLNK